jgi:hypothetical protein
MYMSIEPGLDMPFRIRQLSIVISAESRPYNTRNKFKHITPTMGDPGEMINPKLRNQLREYGKRRRTDGPYTDNLQVDALVVGGGFGGVFCFYSLRKAGLKTVVYEAGTDLGGTWRWNCYR